MADDNKAERELAEFKWQLEQHQKEREQLFANEALLIGVLQVVSGGWRRWLRSKSWRANALIWFSSALW
jgi:hypothetical protein